MVSALFLIFRIAVLLAYSGNHSSYDHAYVWLIASVVLFGASLFFAIVRPYKVNNLNIIDCLLLGMLSILAWIVLFVRYLRNQRYSHMIGVTGLLIMGIAHAALVLYILYSISKKIRILRHLKRKCRCLLTIICCNEQSQLEANNSHGGLDVDSFPDRLVNPDEYEPLFPAIIQQGSIQTESCAVQARVTPMNTYSVVGDWRQSQRTCIATVRILETLDEHACRCHHQLEYPYIHFFFMSDYSYSHVVIRDNFQYIVYALFNCASSLKTDCVAGLWYGNIISASGICWGCKLHFCFSCMGTPPQDVGRWYSLCGSFILK